MITAYRPPPRHSGLEESFAIADAARFEAQVSATTKYSDIAAPDAYLFLSRQSPMSQSYAVHVAMLQTAERSLKEAFDGVSNNHPELSDIVALRAAISNTAYWAEKNNPAMTAESAAKWVLIADRLVKIPAPIQGAAK